MKGEVTAAIRHYRWAVELQPEKADWHFLLGNALTAKGQFPAAAKAYREALKLESTHQAARENLDHVESLQNRRRPLIGTPR